MDDTIFNIKLDEIKRDINLIKVNENNLDDGLKAKIDSIGQNIPAGVGVSSNQFYLKDDNDVQIGNMVDIVQGVTLNGAETKTPAFYAPLTAGSLGQVLQSNGSGAPTWQTASSGGISMTLLWENANKSSTFNPQFITLSSSDYDILMIMCCCRPYNLTNTYMKTCFMNKGANGTSAVELIPNTDSGYRTEHWGRNFTRVTDVKISCKNCYYAQNYSTVASTNNTLMVPCFIYGIKLS